MDNSNQKFLPYGRQHVFQEDIDAVIEILKSDWLTQGPTIEAFEDALAERVGARYAVACSSGTAALHLAMLALKVGPGDRVITTANTFLADANAARFVGADIAFADIDRETGTMSLEATARLLEGDGNYRQQVIVPVHFAGQPVELDAFYELAEKHGAYVVDDACHALGAVYEHGARRYKVGCGEHSDLTVFSFHPVKHVAMGEGGAITTNDAGYADRLRLLRNHGMKKEDLTNEDMALAPDGRVNPWYYEMAEIGYNYRLTDIQAALGLAQLNRLDWSVRRRNEIAFSYHRQIEQVFNSEGILPLHTRPGVIHAYHLFVVQIDFDRFGVDRATVMNRLREAGIGTQVHYIPVPLQPYYQNLNGYRTGDFPNAEAYYRTALSLPMYPDLTENDIERVVTHLRSALQGS